MSPSTRSARGPAGHRRVAPIFAALGDDTRLAIVATLSEGKRRSIAQLTEGSGLTRQAVTKHLRVLEHAGIVHGIRHGRESLFELDPEPILSLRDYVDLVSTRWDRALERLRRLVEG